MNDSWTMLYGKRIGKKLVKLSSNSSLISIFHCYKWFPKYMIILFIIVLVCLIISIYVLILWLSSLSSEPSIALNSFDLPLRDPKAQVLARHQNVIQLTIDRNNFVSTPTNSSCHFYNCFDVYRCGNYDHDLESNEELIGVYIYPSINFIDTNGKSILGPISHQFRQLLEAVIDSPYYTSDPSKACLFIPNIDLLNQLTIRSEETSKVLSSLPYWDSRGSNHLVFNMISGDYPHYNTRPDLDMGNALIAGAGLDLWSYRQTFDVSIPFYSLLSNDHNNNKNYDPQEILGRTRKWLVVCALYDAVSDDNQQILKDLELKNRNQMLVLRNDCNQKDVNETELCDIRSNDVYIYPKVLTETTFCLILETVFLGHPVLSDSLMMGCIPVIVSDNYVLPFEEKLDWKRFSVRIWSHSLPDLLDLLAAIPQQRIGQMREQSVFIWKHYFSSMKVIALTTLKIINERVFPNSASSSNHWNGPPKPSISKEYAIISPKLSSRQSIGFTAVILTYDRLESLYEVIRSVVRARSCVKVLVIWNNQLKSPPTLDKWPDIQVPLEVMVTSANKLSNRFYPYESIETDAILAIDDDIVMLTPDELEFGYQAWTEFPDRIVGFPSRVHRWDNITSRWKYESEWTNDVSMVLTGAAFYHKYYNHLYTNIMPVQIKSWVDQHMNCEDIAMNFLVSNVTGKAPIKVTPRKKFKCPECTNNGMLSADVLRHLYQRSECMNRFVAVYGRMPLVAVEFRADPVLYKDNLPEKLKTFNSIGSL